jgi:vitamin-K-epoxide reductase (warfarin-sensitive)
VSAAMIAPTDVQFSRAPVRGKLFLAITLLSLAGMIVSAIALQRHYAKSATNYCDFGQQFNCDVVNRSEYSSIMGIPVAAIGVAGYGVILALATYLRKRVETPARLLFAATTGLAFTLYLTYIEAYVLITWCILCLISLAVISIITVLAAWMRFVKGTDSAPASSR